jgi:hypothetical protein
MLWELLEKLGMFNKAPNTFTSDLKRQEKKLLNYAM